MSSLDGKQSDIVVGNCTDVGLPSKLFSITTVSRRSGRRLYNLKNHYTLTTKVPQLMETLNFHITVSRFPVYASDSYIHTILFQCKTHSESVL